MALVTPLTVITNNWPCYYNKFYNDLARLRRRENGLMKQRTRQPKQKAISLHDDNVKKASVRIGRESNVLIYKPPAGRRFTLAANKL